MRKSNYKHLIQLKNLTHITIGIDQVDFDEFEEFLLKSLKVLTESLDINYLDSHRWEQLIRKHLPQLNQFILRYTDIINEDFPMNSSHSLIKGFTSSSFWQNDQSIINRINPILNLIPLICLDIQSEKLSTNMLIQILNYLPNLRSIRIERFPFCPSVKLSLSTKTIKLKNSFYIIFQLQKMFKIFFFFFLELNILHYNFYLMKIFKYLFDLFYYISKPMRFVN